MGQRKYYEIENVTTVYLDTDNSEIIVCGIPGNDDEEHSCDSMGCNSVEHILLRCWAKDKHVGFTMLQDHAESKLPQKEGR